MVSHKDVSLSLQLRWKEIIYFEQFKLCSIFVAVLYLTLCYNVPRHIGSWMNMIILI